MFAFVAFPECSLRVEDDEVGAGLVFDPCEEFGGFVALSKDRCVGSVVVQSFGIADAVVGGADAAMDLVATVLSIDDGYVCETGWLVE